MKVNFRQGIISHQAGGFLQITGSVVSLTAVNRPVTLTIAHKNANYTHSEDNTVNTAWIGPFTETNYWLYWDFNPLTFNRTFGHTTLEPVAQSIAPGTGNVDITGAIPGAAGFGSFIVDEFYNLPTGKSFAVIDSSNNNGTYTVSSVAYSTSTGKTTISVDAAVASNVADGLATLDLDLNGNPLYVEGRHWFDTTNNIHNVLTAGNWVPVIRVFAAQLFNATTFISVSQNAQVGDYTGTQIGNNADVFSGRVLFDEASNPMRRDNATFFTTEDQFFTNQSRVDALRLESNVSRAQSVASTLSAFSVVAWTGDGQITSAEYDDVGSTVVGMLTENLSNLEVGAVIVQGTITNPAWNWTQGTTPVPVGSALWAENGMLVTVDPHLSDPVQYQQSNVPIARVLDKDTIIFEQGLGGAGPRGPQGAIAGLPPADTTNLGGVTLLTSSSDPLRAFVISDTDSRLTNARAPLAHTHQAGDISFQPNGGLVSNNVQATLVELGNGKVNTTGGIMTGQLTLITTPANPGHATSKQYVDNLVNGLIWLDPIDGVNLISDVVVAEPSTPNNGDGYILPNNVASVGSPGTWAGLQGDILAWDGSVWQNFGQLSALTSHSLRIRLGIAIQSGTTPSGSFVGKKNQIVSFDNLGVIIGYETPVNNNAVYVEGGASLFAFDQYAFNGTAWTKIAGSSQGITSDGITTTISGGVMSVIPALSGGQVDALMLSGNTLTDLDSRYSGLAHTHTSLSITFAPYLGDTTWGVAVDVLSGQVLATDMTTAISTLADTKAEKTPLYATAANLPSATTEKGMVAVVDDDNTVYFADDVGWSALSRGDHVHTVPYDMAFYLHGALVAGQNIGIFTITKDVYVPIGATGSLAVAGLPASSLPTNILIKRDVAPYGTPTDIGSIAYAAGSVVGVITWTGNVSFKSGDILILATDSAPSDVEQISVTIVGCSIANTCILPPPPTVDFIPDIVPLLDGDLITGGTGSVNLGGLRDTIVWTQPEYSVDGGINWLPSPGTITQGDVVFSDTTTALPIVSEAVQSGYQYRVRITVSGPGGTNFDEEVIKFTIA